MIAFIPQAYQVWKTKNLEGVSASTYGLLTFSAILWTSYGFLKNDNPIIFTNIILGSIQLSILYCKWKYGKVKI